MNMTRKPKRPRDEVLTDLQKLVLANGYIYALLEILSQDFFVNAMNVANVNWRDRRHNNEFALMMGLILKNPAIDFQEISER